MPKKIGNYIYVHKSALSELTAELQDKVRRLIPEFSYSVIKVNIKEDRVSFLNYPKFWSQDFPELKESWTVVNGVATHRKYNQKNPPILHRKEMFILPSHKDIDKMKALTKRCEDAGLFADVKRIGKKMFWEDLLEGAMI